MKIMLPQLPQASTEQVFSSLRQELSLKGFKIIKEEQRPWGGFFVMDDKQINEFLTEFFKEVNFSESIDDQKLSPKFLIVAPNKRLSWQYHHRRAEIWKVISGLAGIVRSSNDDENEVETFEPGQIIFLEQGERHRLVGLENWGIVAEIWKHSNPAEPSNEDDIVRITDDFGR